MQNTLNNLFNKVNKEKYDKYLELIPDFKKEKTQKFTTVVLTLISIIVLAIFAINPTLSTIANLQKQLDDAKFVTQKLDQKINNLSLLQAKYNNVQSDLPVIYESIPQQPEVPKLTGQIQSLVNNSNLKLISFQAFSITESSSKKFSYYSFNLTGEGQYEDMINFLNKITNMQRIIIVSNININQPSNNIGHLQLNIRGTAFFKP